MSTEKGSLEAEASAPQSPPPAYDSSQTNYGFQANNPVPSMQQNYGSQQTAAPLQNTSYPPQNYGYAPQQQIMVTQVQPGYGLYQTPPPDYTTQAYLACLCCFWPTGLVAIMKANESRDAAARGDMITAHAAANSARSMVRISWIIGLLSVVLLAVFLGVYFGVYWNALYDYDD